MLDYSDYEDISRKLQSELTSATSHAVEKYLRVEIENTVTELRNAYDMGDEEIFDEILKFHDGPMTEFEESTLAEILGVS